jgi:hypothetical protein
MGDSTDRALKPLSLMAWGLLLVVLDLRVDGLDLVPDPLGWVFVLLAALRLRPLHAGFTAATVAAVVGLVASLPDWVGVAPNLAGTATTLAETVLVFATCTAIMALVPDRRGRANTLRWWDLALTVILVPLVVLAVVEPGFVVLALFAGLAALVVLVCFLVLLFRTAGDRPVRIS